MAMKIGRISQLIGGLVSSSDSAASKNAEGASQESSQIQNNQNSEAVSVSPEISSSSSSESDRAKYVADIKSRVDSGSYNVSSDKIASALVRDLF